MCIFHWFSISNVNSCTISHRFLKGRANDGFPMDLEDFIRISMRSFPFRESNLFKHIVKTLAGVEKVSASVASFRF